MDLSDAPARMDEIEARMAEIQQELADMMAELSNIETEADHKYFGGRPLNLTSAEYLARQRQLAGVFHRSANLQSKIKVIGQ